MNYQGVFQSFQPIIGKEPRLFAYVNNIEIIIHYNAEQPFYVEQIAVLLDSHIENGNRIEAYDVFECGLPFQSETDAKAFAVSFAKNLIKYRQELLRYMH